MKNILLFMGLLFTSLAQAQIDVEVAMDSTNILVGDQTTLRLKVKHNKQQKIWFPMGTTLGDKTEILKYGKVDTVQSTSTITFSQDLLITAWDSGVVTIPSIGVPFAAANASTPNDTAFSQPITFNVSMISLIDSNTIAPIKEIIDEPLKFEDYKKYVFGLLGVLLIAFLVWYLIPKGTEEAPKIAAPVIVLPPHTIALNQLKTLEEKALWQKGKVKAYQTELTHTIREYLENRYQIQALENTTGEILTQLHTANLSTDLQNKIRNMLNIADLVKFAKAQPEEEIHKKLMEDAISFVHQTQEVIDTEEA